MGYRVPIRALTLAVAPFVIGLVTLLALRAIEHWDGAAESDLSAGVLGLSAATAVAVVVLPRLVSRSPSLIRSIFMVALCAMTVTGIAVALSSATMEISTFAAGQLVLLFALGAGLGVTLELAVALSMSHDLRRLADAARQISAGHAATPAALERADELGRTARVVDRLALELRELEQERTVAKISREAFLAGIGHDLRTPLAALRAALEALEDDLAPDAGQYYAAMHHDIEALTGLVEDLFLLARIEAGLLDFARVPVDLAELADEAVEALLPLAHRSRVTLRLVTAGSVFTSGGPAELSRAIRNLIDNAVRHSPADMEVIVEVVDPSSPLVRVIDRGPGFPSAIRDAVEAALEVVPSDIRRGVGGAGLGLVIASRLADAHGGRIEIDPGPGGRVTLMVPPLHATDR